MMFNEDDKFKNQVYAPVGIEDISAKNQIYQIKSILPGLRLVSDEYHQIEEEDSQCKLWKN
jgi:hypothetical protein